MESKCRNFFRQKLFSKIYILYILFMYIMQKLFYYTDKGLRKNIKKERDGEIEKYKLNEMETLSMK